MKKSFIGTFWLILAALRFGQVTVGTSSCDVGKYGVPNYNDCIMAFNQVPYALQRSSLDANIFGIYSEPQYLKVPFSPVMNTKRPRPITQLPKIWRHSMSASHLAQYHHIRLQSHLTVDRYLSDRPYVLWSKRRTDLQLSLRRQLEGNLGSTIHLDSKDRPPEPGKSLWRICSIRM